MGWLFTHRPKGHTTQAWFEEHLLGDTDRWGRFLKTRVVDGVFYAAWQLGDAHGDDAGQVTALVVLTQWAKGQHNYGYKDMTESMGPCEAKCPDVILDLLTHDPGEHGVEWRQRCRDYNAKLRIAKAVKPGDTVVFAKAIPFTNGDELAEFVFEGDSRFKAGYSHYRIRDWREMPFLHVAA